MRNRPRISYSQQGESGCNAALQGYWAQEDLRGVDGDVWEPVGDGDGQLSVGVVFLSFPQVKREGQLDHPVRY